MDSSIIGRLPAELRIMIYEYALQEGYDGTDTVYLEPDVRSKLSLGRLRAAPVPEGDKSGPLQVCGLPATCKQLRRESLALYYSINRFYIQTEYLKSDEKDDIMEQIRNWTKSIGLARAHEMRDITISLASFKDHQHGQHVPLHIEWNHMRDLRLLFHPRGRLGVRFYLQGSKTATFTLGSRASIEEQLDRMAELWCMRWQKTRKYSEWVARTMANMDRADVARLFVDMPEHV